MFPRDGRLSVTLVASGLWVAGIGFFVTRFTVTLAAYEGRTQFLVSGVVPLVLGLLLAAFGVSLVVGSFDPDFARTVAVWCTAGTLAMAGLVALTLVGTTPGDLSAGDAVRPGTVLSNFLIGGALLGALTGLYAGQNRRNRVELRQQANRLVTINRILRHEVLNAVAVIRGWAETPGHPGPHALDDGTLGRIREEADHIVDTIDDVKHLTRTTAIDSGVRYSVDLAAAVEDALAVARNRYVDAEFVFDGEVAPDVRVWADEQLSHALYPLVENAAVHTDSAAPVVTVEVAVGRDVARVRIVDEGTGLPDEQRATLERGEIPDFDDPTAGFGTNIARMFVEGYEGDIRTEASEAGTTVEVSLALAPDEGPSRTDRRSLRSVGVDRSHLLAASGSAIVAGGVMGLFIQVTAGVIPVIGALYGVSDPLVGWITHEFHSVVFGLIYAGLLTLLPGGRGDRLVGRLAVGIGWGLFLWLVAAGVIMPIWLNLVGIPASIPSVTAAAFQSHLLWGVSLGVTYHVCASWLAAR